MSVWYTYLAVGEAQFFRVHSSNKARPACVSLEFLTINTHNIIMVLKLMKLVSVSLCHHCIAIAGGFFDYLCHTHDY